MKLGGWWRLWIALSGFYVAILAIVSAANWPSIRDITHGPWLTYRLTASSQDLLRQPISIAGLEAALVAAHRAGNTDEARRYAHQILEARSNSWQHDPIVVIGPNGHSFDLPASASRKAIADFEQDYQRVLRQEVEGRRTKILREFFIVGAVPPFFLLLVGTTCGWVLRGFRRRTNE